MHGEKNGLLYDDHDSRIIGCLPGFDGIIPYGAVSIGSHAFAGCRAEQIILPESVTYLEEGAFADSVSVKSVVLPKYLKKLPPYLFKDCRSLEKVEFPFEVESFPAGLFSGCSSLEAVPFRAGLSSLPEKVFSGCSRLVSVVIPDTVHSIASFAFENCSGLTTLVLPAGLDFIHDKAFSGCPDLQHIRISENNTKYFTAGDGCLYERQPGTNRLILPVSVPHRKTNSVTGISSGRTGGASADTALVEYLKSTAGYFTESTGSCSGTEQGELFVLVVNTGDAIPRPLEDCCLRIADFFGLSRLYFFCNFPLEKPEFLHRIQELSVSHNFVVAITAPKVSLMSDKEKNFIQAFSIDMKKNEEFVRNLNNHRSVQIPFKLVVRNPAE